jgi:hypothetical protein
MDLLTILRELTSFFYCYLEVKTKQNQSQNNNNQNNMVTKGWGEWEERSGGERLITGSLVIDCRKTFCGAITQ